MLALLLVALLAAIPMAWGYVNAHMTRMAVLDFIRLARTVSKDDLASTTSTQVADWQNDVPSPEGEPMLAA